ncbi:MAG: flagellar basal body rod protein FlgC [Deltaproteobacteria bacterium]|jgi:flagellar basal-body rod protein FlgC|nr:flagellar basal body rod protein FlgC [Deltaproteobacteria bacterium]MBW2469092.1 flagellar basal body rod protein FlgC [Deltaproteobacteria bacterium]MBW2489484.1 flagellar basal body rod protein FlgC [Deltaproteobacteria bacterium]MBW2515589.1 flagellar basal body rod protein FlgC [Deltaproteobacteria bacterium]
MDFFDAMNISSSGLSAQRLRMNLISANLANVNTTRTKYGGPYRRKDPVFAAQAPAGSFREMLRNRQKEHLKEVAVVGIVEDSRPFIQKYDPTHPDSDDNGYLSMPNINLMEEMVNMISATRSYEAGVTAIQSAKNMALKALEIGQ